MAERLILDEYAPPCVSSMRIDILYFHGSTDRYLMQPHVSKLNLIAMAREDFASAQCSAQ